ncbi:GNAT family N-acetyltransferase [Flavobacterium silvaticum]|uniref:GNAT family N-acetyltransferase n=1 Tax=Flavobacterium silvaticum TaxID=1852020 RepID=A0A972FWF8_9FLAO|nr:GNAT family N-acetyltransferase [Flavobacterium silvaticum]NMH28895.1 GNAT family N-acetyltransferase [Flavobacterium silvaticum]
MQIRNASEADAAVISQIALATWPDTYGEILSADQLEYMLDRFCSADAILANMQNGQQFLLAFDEMDSAVGFAAFTIKDDFSAHLNKLYVLPATQGKNLGKLLLGEVSKRSSVAGCTRLTLNVNRFNKAKTFYERLGFSIISEIDIPIGNGWLMEDFVMSRDI